MRPLTCVLLAAAAAAPAQQLSFARNDNTSYGSYAVGWPASVIAFRFTAPAPMAVAAAQVFTGNTAPAPHTLELRDHDLGTGLPGALLGAAGGWTTTHARCWQGPTLPQIVGLAGGQDYWLVWRVTGMFPQHSVAADGNPANVPVETRISDGNSWHGQAMLPGKFRLFAPYPAGATFAFGSAQAGTHGNPSIGISGWPAVGSAIDVWLDDAVRRQPAVLLVGLPAPAGIVFPFGTSWTTAEVALFTTTVTQSSPFVGGATWSFFVPDVPAAVGFPLTFQWGVVDPLAASGIAHTGAVTALLQ
jgi:hypothetical protein